MATLKDNYYEEFQRTLATLKNQCESSNTQLPPIPPEFEQIFGKFK